jgi:hypothetical protein
VDEEGRTKKRAIRPAEIAGSPFVGGVTAPDQEVTVSDEYRKLSREELNELAGEELPERAVMSLINANLAIPINAAVAANVRSHGPQQPNIEQGSEPGEGALE